MTDNSGGLARYAINFALPVPPVWQSVPALPAADRAALTRVTKLIAHGDMFADIADEAHRILNAQHTPLRFVLLVATHEQTSRGVGEKVAMPTVPDETSMPARTLLWVREDLLVGVDTLPLAYREHAARVRRFRGAAALVLARLVAVDEDADTVTVELFSKTDQYEISVPRQLALGAWIYSN